MYDPTASEEHCAAIDAHIKDRLRAYLKEQRARLEQTQAHLDVLNGLSEYEKVELKKDRERSLTRCLCLPGTLSLFAASVAPNCLQGIGLLSCFGGIACIPPGLTYAAWRGTNKGENLSNIVPCNCCGNFKGLVQLNLPGFRNGKLDLSEEIKAENARSKANAEERIDRAIKELKFEIEKGWKEVPSQFSN